MPAQFSETVQHVCSIASVCFSFCILVLSVFFKNAEKKPRLFALAFLPVFVLSLTSVISHGTEISAIAALYADVLLLPGILAAILFRSGHVSAALSITTPPAVITAICLSSPFRDFLYRHQLGSALMILAAIAILYLLKNEKGNESLVYWAVVLLAASAPAGLFLRTGTAILAAPLLKISSYIVMLSYFYRAFLKHLIDEYEASRKKLSAIDRSIEAEVRKRLHEVERVNRKLLDKSKTDPLTGLLNKAAILAAAERLLTDRPEKAHSILMFDIDDFKDINDTHGHITGDKCIRMLAAVIRNNFRGVDMAGRYGGDEFIAILPDTNARQAVAIAERFRKTIDETSLPHFTISTGVSSYPEDGQNVRALIEEADRNLYRSKKKGKNAVSRSSVY
ncbi:MAG TPA: GGDEF domain-containing protein [Clostridiales bacterium]|nr:GGDEF domain-containing protein [Clostridiales bacterium]